MSVTATLLRWIDHGRAYLLFRMRHDGVPTKQAQFNACDQVMRLAKLYGTTEQFESTWPHIEIQRAVGMRKYGRELAITDARDMLREAMAEAVDLCVYLSADVERHGDTREGNIADSLLTGAVDLMLRVGGELARREDGSTQ